MSRKKTHKYDYFLFANNINKLVSANGGKYAFADSIGVVYDSVRRWCNGENVPDGEKLLSIRDKYGISIDALLTSPDPERIYAPKISETPAEYGACADSLDNWPEEIKNACRQVKKILQSEHPVIKPALLTNLAAFEYSVEKEKSQDAEIRNRSTIEKLPAMNW